ncbi:MAG TPA: shikimate dehydrogenase [Bacteroidales bacterium]|nr:shikimate dehydrogenase [Bacteroidales bacterium]
MRLFGLTGNPLGHSFSKTYFEKKFRDEQIHDCCYEVFSLSDVLEIRKLIDTNPELEGLNVTIPFKQSVIPLLDETDALASSIGAVNCLKVCRQGNLTYIKGFNTDAPAFLETLMPIIQPHHKKALVLGTGGASKAVQYALTKLDLAFRLVSRTKAENCITYADLNEEIIRDHLLLVNTTPLGMSPDTGTSPDIPYQFLTGEHLLYDLVYNPELTEFLRKGKEKHAQIKNGLEMLHLQAEKAWKIWNSEL